MSTPLEPVQRSLAAFMAGGEFWPLWRAVMSAASLDARLSQSEESWFDSLYELVYTAAPDPLSPEDEEVGLIGSVALRAAIRNDGLDRPSQEGPGGRR